MKVTHSADSVFGTRSRVRVLRVLHGVTVPLNTARLASLTRLSKPAVSTALDELAAMGLVDRSPAGRSWVHWLVRDNVYVRAMVDPVFAAEAEIPETLERELKEAFGGHALSVVLFGSYARGEQGEKSDIDVVLVGEDERAKARLDAESDEQLVKLSRRFGSSLSPLVYDAREAGTLWSRAPDLLASIERDGIVVCGLTPSEWRRHAEEA
jgi:predicted nucleotidyltransferase